MSQPEFIVINDRKHYIEVEECYIDKRTDYWHDVHYYIADGILHLVRVIGGTEDGGECEYPHLLTDKQFLYDFCDFIDEQEQEAAAENESEHAFYISLL